jgi:hypothetical protein
MLHVIFVQFINHDDTLPGPKTAQGVIITFSGGSSNQINQFLSHPPTHTHALIALSTVWIGLGKETEDLFRLP